MQETTEQQLEDIREIRLSDYFWMLFRNKWSALTIFLLAVLGAFLVTDFTTPVYQSETTVRVVDGQQTPSLLSQLPLSGLFGSTSLGAYAAQLQSRDLVIAPAVRQLRAEGVLEPLPVHRGRTLMWLTNLFNTLFNIDFAQDATEQGKLTVEEWEDYFIKTLIDEQLKVEESSDGNVITISVKQRTPERAQQLCNKIVSVFQQVVAAETAEQMRWWEKPMPQAMLAETRQHLKTAEEELFNFQREYPEITLNAEGGTQAQLILALQLKENELLGLLAGAALSLQEYAAELAKVEENLVSETVATNPSYAKLRDNLHEYEIERQGMTGKYDETHPDIVALDKKIAETQARLTEEEKQLRSTTTAYNPLHQALTEKVNEAEANIKNLTEQKSQVSAQIAAHIAQLSTWSSQQIRLFRLKRDVEIYSAQNVALEAKMRESEIVAEARTENLKVLDMARVPEEPIAPRMKLNLVLGAMLGGLLGFTFAVAKNYFQDTYLRLEEAVRQLESLPNPPSFLGVIPPLKELKSRKRQRRFRVTQRDVQAPTNPSERLAHDRRAFRVLQAKLPFLTPGSALKTVLVTSATRGEGKSTVSANLAAVLAQKGNRVLLIDADMRRPSQHKTFPIEATNQEDENVDIDNVDFGLRRDTPSHQPTKPNTLRLTENRKPGLSEALMTMDEENGYDVFHATVKPTGVPNLHLVSGGTVPPNPIELLNSEMMSQWLDLARETYDIVVIDSPPVRAVADAVILAPIVDAVVYVFDITKTRRFDMLTGARHLTQVLPTKSIGVLCNMIHPKHAKSYGYYSRQTSYYELAEKG